MAKRDWAWLAAMIAGGVVDERDSFEAQLNDALSQTDQLKKQRAELQAQLHARNATIAGLQDEIAKLKKTIAEIDKKAKEE